MENTSEQRGKQERSKKTENFKSAKERRGDIYGEELSVQGEEVEEEDTSLSQQVTGENQEEPTDSEEGEKPTKVRVTTKVSKEERKS